MQPQNPTPPTPPTPDPNPATPPAPTPPTQPEPAPAQPSVAPQTPAAGQPLPPQPSKKPSMALIGVIVGVIILIAAAVGAYLLLFNKNGLALQTYSNENFSLEVPVGYAQGELEGGIVFTERDEDPQSQSVVFASYSAYPESVDQEQIDIIKDALKTDPRTSLQSVSGTTDTIEDVKTEDVKFKGVDAIQVSGRSVRDGQTTGTFKMVMVVDKDAVYAVGVGAHSSDPALEAKIDDIINSFTLKQ